MNVTQNLLNHSIITIIYLQNLFPDINEFLELIISQAEVDTQVLEAAQGIIGNLIEEMTGKADEIAQLNSEVKYQNKELILLKKELIILKKKNR